ncbi:GDP-mannose 4,6-dehydratase [Fodinisporobacter ferrooxydans]|uniref:GDP-mannose 4,6-dehydratase n=1 Tax=Fodinisporobacter ferrooxydans TaxID=2901836 RepID=A0ABY4CPJ2_9BACL|nr:GDP-mannose 4,6-dehydratase [Alicyclobacillaceae bacterium MYW30-H2]
MKKILVTGATGFVGKHLIELLLTKEDIMIWGTTHSSSPNKDMQVSWETLDLLNTNQVREMINKVKPDVIFHLAGQSNVRKSWEQKDDTFQINVIGTIHLLDAVKEFCPEAIVLTVGSSEEYGFVKQENMPINETSVCNPMNPYGISKLSVALLSKQYYQSCGLNCIHVRPFNHIGPGQSLGFVTTDFAKQIVSIELELQENKLKVGNLEAHRDFTDVRDIVCAYWLLSQKGKSGEIYNVSVGKGIKISTIVKELAKRSNKEIQIIQDSKKFRPIDVPFYIGDCSKIERDCGWIPKISLSKTLDDIMNDWRQRLSK